MLPPVAIPSLGRYDTISQKTLLYLQQVGYPKDLIYIFVVPEEEDLYRSKVPESLYHRIVVGKRGLQEQRSFIRDFFPDGSILLCMDDDILGVKSLLYSFRELIEMGVEEIQRGETGLWGIMPNDDGRKLNHSTTNHLSFIIGCCFLMRNHQDINLTTTHLDDYERCMLYFQRYGRVTRYRGAGVKTTYNEGEGGLICPDRHLQIKAQAEELSRRFPGLCREIVKRYDRPDLELNWRAKPSTI